MDRVNRYGELLKNFHGAMEKLCQEATKYAEEEYGRYNHPEISVRYDNPDGTFATIIAEDKGEVAQIAFFEFGTGDVGNGRYPDTTKLPKSGVPITESWVYYYDSPAKRTSHGVRGWFWDNKFHTGNAPEAEMWKTSQYIQTRARQIIQAYFKAESGG